MNGAKDLGLSRLVERAARRAACTKTVEFRTYDPSQIVQELAAYCETHTARVGLPVGRRGRLEFPPQHHEEIAPVREAVLEPVHLRDLCRYQVETLVVDAASPEILCVAHPVSAREKSPPSWIRKVGSKVFEQGKCLRLVDVVKVGAAAFSHRGASDGDLSALALRADELFRKDVLDRGSDLLCRASPTEGTDPVDLLTLELIVDRLLDSGLVVSISKDIGGYDKTWAADWEIDARCRAGETLSDAIRLTMAERIRSGIEADGSSVSGATTSDRVKDQKKAFQERRSARLGAPRSPIAPEIRRSFALLQVEESMMLALASLGYVSRLQAAVEVAREHLNRAREGLGLEEKRLAKVSPGIATVLLGKGSDLTADPRAITDDQLSRALALAPEWVDALLSKHSEADAAVEELLKSPLLARL